MNSFLSVFSVSALCLAIISGPACSARQDGVPDEKDLDDVSRAVLGRVSRPESISQGEWDKIIKIYKLQMLWNVEITFHGKILDQDLVPVAGAQVSGTILSIDPHYIENIQNGSKDQKHAPWTARTDEKGLFSVTGHRGYSLDVTKIEKSGYLARNLPASYSYSTDPRESPGKWTASATPAEFKIWRDDGSKPELVKKEVRIRFPHDDIERRIDLLIGGQATTNEVPFDIGLRVNLKKGEGQKSDLYRWTFSLRAPGGGLVETSDRTPVKAPEGGYIVSFKGEVWEKRPWLFGDLHKTYYLRSRDGMIYAAIRVIFDGNQNGYTDVTIHSVANPSGSRDLLSPSTLPTPPSR